MRHHIYSYILIHSMVFMTLGYSESFLFPVPVTIDEREANDRVAKYIENLKESVEQSQLISETAKSWLIDHADLVPWIDYVTPKEHELTDEELYLALLNNSLGDTFTGHLKSLITTVKDSQLGEKEKTDLFQNFLSNLSKIQPTYALGEKVFSSIYDNEGAPKGLRSTIFLTALVENIAYRRGHNVDTFVTHNTLSGTINPQLKEAANALSTYNLDTVQGITSLILNRSTRPLSHTDLLILNNSFDSLLTRNKTKLAQNLVTNSSHWKLNEGIDKKVSELKNDISRRIKASTTNTSIHRALSNIFLEHLEKNPQQATKVTPKLSETYHINQFDQETKLSYLIERIKNESIYDEELYFWGFVGESLPVSEATDDLVLDLIKRGASIASEVDDQRLSDVFDICGTALDLDNPDLLDRYIKIAKPYTNNPNFPITSASLLTREALMRLRCGDYSQNFEENLTAISSKEKQDYRDQILLERYLALNDTEKIKELISSKSEGYLYKPNHLANTLEALDRIGETEKAHELRTDLLPKAFRTELLNHWLVPSIWSSNIFRLAEQFGKKNPIPKKWLNDSLARTSNSFDQLNLQIRWHFHSKDYSETIKFCNRFLDQYPTYYDYYYYRGVSYKKNNQPELAVKDLTKYMQYSANEPRYYHASNHLAELKGNE